jgi:hypothetical protein
MTCTAAMNEVDEIEMIDRLRCQILEALVILNDLPPHPERTRLGRYLMGAQSLANAWGITGSMDGSRGIEPHV